MCTFEMHSFLKREKPQQPSAQKLTWTGGKRRQLRKGAAVNPCAECACSERALFLLCASFPKSALPTGARWQCSGNIHHHPQKCAYRIHTHHQNTPLAHVTCSYFCKSKKKREIEQKTGVTVKVEIINFNV